MTDQSTVPHTEISLRLTILSEFLFDEEKSVKELYKSWTRRIGGRIIDFAKFEYWHRRFKNDQFDLGYDTSQDSMEISATQNTMIPEAKEVKDVSTMTIDVKVVERSMEDLKLDHQVEDTPQVSKTHGKNAAFEDPNAIQVANENRSETSNVSNEENFDFGNTSQDCKENAEIQNTIDPEARGDEGVPTKIIETEVPVEIVKRKTEDLKLNHQFNEKDVPEIFKTIMNDRMKDLVKISLELYDDFSRLLIDDLHVHLMKKTDNWTVLYKCTEKDRKVFEKIETADPEKSIVQHLWFMLKNPKIKLDRLLLRNEYSEMEYRNAPKIDIEKLNTLLQSMIKYIDKQFHVKRFGCEGYNENTFLSMLKPINPVTLEDIIFDISWKEEVNYQELKEIMKTDQWKQAKQIYSCGVTPLKVDDLFHCETFGLTVESFTSEFVLSVTKHFFNFTNKKSCYLSSKNQNFDIIAIIDFLHAHIDGSEIIETYKIDPQCRRGFKIVKSAKYVLLNVFLDGPERNITIKN